MSWFLFLFFIFLHKQYTGAVTLFVCILSRWVRLLFGREFPLQDLLVVWDALFADSITLDLVDYVFVAMLLYIRDARRLITLLKSPQERQRFLFVLQLVH